MIVGVFWFDGGFFWGGHFISLDLCVKGLGLQRNCRILYFRFNPIQFNFACKHIYIYIFVVDFR